MKRTDTIIATKESFILRACMGLCFLLVLQQSRAQQQPMYSQYMFNMMNINPAYAGSRGVVSATALYRNQWVNMPGAPQTSSVSVDMSANQNRIGVGVQLFDDRLGIERTTGINVSYAFRIRMSGSGTLSLGLQGGALNYRANFTEARTFQPNDPAFYQNVNGILPAAAAGIYYNSDKFYFGASVPALLKTKLRNGTTVDVTSGSRDMHYFVTSGTVLKLGEDFMFKPSVLMKVVSGAPVQFDLNSNLWIQNTIAFGFSYRTGDAMVGMLEWQMNPKLRFGYAYDHTFSNLGVYNRGTHELMLRMEFGSGNGKIASPRYF
ncbi:PorP/SprF family type IX secretion system membrane protein [Sediminibacterium goheungense]|uniref:Type IX secretion system PorP/SprF family membrane protein n=1 Tax=Sediminibacterium goheungense TaxID=1086393 RepID=A0A4R6INM3_9BACT|nr:type IX secretion system membrane protein PorP/SprF [Sediminibacterium goheungense]TDO23586.1 type IX secretion system PorP/SprF family membrane protein [Sediminibacterium goheungense]